MMTRFVAVMVFVIGAATVSACGPVKPEVEAARRSALTTGTWTMVTQQYALPDRAQPGTATLLPDGRVLASGPETSCNWYTLTPDTTGSYQNGNWVLLGPAPVGRLFHPSFVLRDGRFWTGGGEYINLDGCPPAPPPQPGRAQNEIFDPVTNTWAAQPNMPQEIADTPAALLPNGQLLVLSHSGLNSYLFSSFGGPASWSRAASWNPLIGDQEASSLLLPDGSVLAGTLQYQRYLPLSNVWVPAALPPGGAGTFVATGSDEMGPFVLLHDGRALILGSSSRNGLYTPPASAFDPGSWTLAADTPANLNHGDAPSVVEPDGRVLGVVTNDPLGIGRGQGTFYEYDPSLDAWTLISTPFTFDAERTLLFPLPNGQIWASGSGAGSSGTNAWLYTPAGSPQPGWRPTITSVSAPSYGEYTLSGTQLNGLTTGGDFGDDNKMTTNFPVVWLVDGTGQVLYGRTYNFDQMAPRPNTAGTTSFRLPVGVAAGACTLHLSANGVEASNTMALTVPSGPRVVSLTGSTRQAPGGIALMRVTLASPAPAGGASVDLTSTAPSVATVPVTVTVPAGQTGINFNLTTVGYGKTTIKAAATTNPAFGATRDFGWWVTDLSGPIVPTNGTSVTLTVTLDSPALWPGVVVNLQSSNPSTASVPATVTVPESSATATFDVSFVDPTGPPSVITASLVGSSRALTVGYTVTAHTVVPSPVPVGGTSTATVTLNGNAPPAGLPITLSKPANASAPSGLTIAAGSSTGTYSIAGLSPGSGYIRARIGTTGAFLPATFPIDYALQSLTGPVLPPTGNSATWTVSVGGSAPAGGLQIALQSSNPAGASVPASVPIPAGSSSATFPVTMLDPAAYYSTITATLGISTMSGAFGYFFTSYTVTPSVIPVGGTGTGTVTINGPAPAGGLAVTLSNPRPDLATFPTSLTIGGSSSTASFTITGSAAGGVASRAQIGSSGADAVAHFRVGP